MTATPQGLIHVDWVDCFAQRRWSKQHGSRTASASTALLRRGNRSSQILNLNAECSKKNEPRIFGPGLVRFEIVSKRLLLRLHNHVLSNENVVRTHNTAVLVGEHKDFRLPRLRLFSRELRKRHDNQQVAKFAFVSGSAV